MSHKRKIGKEDKRDYLIHSLHIVAHGISEKLEIPQQVIDELNKLTFKDAKKAIIQALEVRK